MAVNTQPPNDKSKFLRSVLSEPTKQGDVIPILREVVHILIQVNAELSTLAAVRAEISQLNKFVLDFIEDNLRFRMAREKRESEVNGGALPTASEHWMAVKHLGVVYTALTQVGTPDPPTEAVQLRIDVDMVDGKLIGTASGVDRAGVSFSHAGRLSQCDGHNAACVTHFEPRQKD